MINKFLNWIDYKIDINKTNFTKDLLKNNLNIFWTKVVAKINEDQHIWLLFRLKWTDNQFVTIGKLKN